MKWFRLYNEILDDPKIGQLKDREFRLFIEILCIASQQSDNEHMTGSTRLTNEQLTWRLRRQIKSAMTTLLRLNLIEEKIENGEKIIWVKNWEKRQFTSDFSNERVKRHREKKRECNVTETLQKRKCNALESESDTETEENIINSSAISEVATPSPENHDPPPDLTTTTKTTNFQNVKNFFLKRYPAVFPDINAVLSFWASKKALAMLRGWEREGVTLEDVQAAVDYCAVKGYVASTPLYFATPVIEFCRERQQTGGYRARGSPAVVTEEQRKRDEDSIRRAVERNQANLEANDGIT